MLRVNPANHRAIEAGMPGYVHIFRLDETLDERTKAPTPVYQVNYTVPGSTYVRRFDELRLKEFLVSKVALDPVSLDRVMTDLHACGKANIGDVEISAAEAAGIGLEQVPSEY